MKIKFLSSEKILGIKEKQKGYFQFYQIQNEEESNNNSIIYKYKYNNDNNNDNNAIINKYIYNNDNNTIINQYKNDNNDREKNEEDEKSKLIIHSIFYCLLNIKSLKEKFINIKSKDKLMSNLFIKMKEKQKNNFILESSYAAEIIKSYNNYYKPETLIENIYKILHDELKVVNISQNSNIEYEDSEAAPNLILSKISNKFENEGKSIISDIFYFQDIITYKCNNCGKIKSYTSSIKNHIMFPLKEILNYFNKKDNTLHIFDCFKYLTSNKNTDKKCPNCSNDNSVISLYRIDSTKEILTIVLDRGNNFKDNILFKLDFNIDLKKYFFNHDKPQKYELIGFCTFFIDKNIFIPLYKNYEDNKWYYSDFSIIKEVSNDLDCGIPFLLFYQRIQ